MYYVNQRDRTITYSQPFWSILYDKEKTWAEIM